MAPNKAEDEVFKLTEETHLKLKRISVMTGDPFSYYGTFQYWSNAISEHADSSAYDLQNALEKEGYPRLDSRKADDLAWDWAKFEAGYTGPPDKFEPQFERRVKSAIDDCFKSATKAARAARKSNPEVFKALTSSYQSTFRFCINQRINLYERRQIDDPDAEIRIPDIYHPDVSAWNLESSNFEMPCLDVIDAGNRATVSRNGKLIAGNFKSYRWTDIRVGKFFDSIIYAWLDRVESDMSDEEYWASKKEEKKGCYVATAAYGSYDCPEVWTLRRFRDYELAETAAGRAFIKIYYAISPTLVKWFGGTNWFKAMWRGPLDKLVSRCKAKGHADTPYEDKTW
ncbi:MULTISPECIES: CFI-box-CTERM domain-containing protein [unclassified Adlercreutzia]|uniref:CFI-box-CTERM domain-containing protein n=1 Tax=unclassified Adlercreutzia TaxID=2636013 RepID=UPI0013ED22A8|nr:MULTISPECIES: CFI-box-CTERM domain-containing protein [unclassified Adlercreutzia]